jgi:CheY-like chemotaxis protein
MNMPEQFPAKLGQVLVVDDNPISTESMRQALQLNFEVDSVDSGEACLE